MDLDNFNKLDPTIQMTFVIAMHIRNAMENFHCKHLSDTQMKELNPIIRQAIYDGLTYLRAASNDKSGREKKVALDTIDFLIQLIPDYWELPHEN